MSKPSAYHWDFDRSSWDSSTEASTFSVGIYQWLPTTSGKALKKSKTIRVLGYTADSQGVYRKARELCDRLNGEHARFEALPSWVQKQYSVPKPDGFAKPPRNEFSGAEARAIRNRAVKQHLLPAGFIKSHASTFVRRVGEIVQAVNFQTMTWGGKFTVNLGLHYTFTPAGTDFHRISWRQLDEVQCSLRGRIGRFLPGKLATWLPFGNDADRLTETFEFCIQESVRVLDCYSAKLQDPGALLSGSPRQLVAPFLIWRPEILFATAEMRLNHLDDAESRLLQPLLPEHEEFYRPIYRELLSDIEILRREGAATKCGQKTLTWLID